MGPIQIECDAPEYVIVHAFARVGIRNPADVRWCRMANYLKDSSFVASLRAVGPARVETCSCKEPLPRPRAYLFTLSTGEQVGYLVGQCAGCSTVYWDRTR